MNVIAFDPGKITGFATAEIKADHLTLCRYGQILLLNDKDVVLPEGAVALGRELYGTDRFLCEHFRQSTMAVKGSPAVAVGAIYSLAFIAGRTELPMQSPTILKYAASRYKEVVTVPAGCPHARDAQYHLLYYAHHTLGITDVRIRTLEGDRQLGVNIYGTKEITDGQRN